MPRAQFDPGRHGTIGGESAAAHRCRWGLFPAILEYRRTPHRPQRRETGTLATAAQSVSSPADQRMSWVSRFLLGIARIRPIDRSWAGESARARWLGMARFPSSDPLSARLPKAMLGQGQPIDRIPHALRTEPARFEDAPRIADRDRSAKSTEGRKRQGARPGPHPPSTGRDCSPGAVAFGSGLGVGQRLGRGCPAGLRVVPPAEEALRDRGPPWSIRRLDGGFLAAQVGTDRVGAGLGVRTPAGSPLVSIRPVREPTPPTSGPSSRAPTRRHRGGKVPWLQDVPTLVPVVWVECRRRPTPMTTGRLPGRTKTFSAAIVTDPHPWSTAQISEPSKARWAVEHFFQESNPSFRSGNLPSATFRGNPFSLGLRSLVDNLMQFFKRDCLPTSYRNVSFATVRRPFLEHAVMIEDHGDGVILLIFSEDSPLKCTANRMLQKTLAA